MLWTGWHSSQRPTGAEAEAGWVASLVLRSVLQTVLKQNEIWMANFVSNGPQNPLCSSSFKGQHGFVFGSRYVIAPKTTLQSKRLPDAKLA